MITRGQWGARYGQGAAIGGGLRLVVVHHTVTPDLSPDATQAQEIEAIQGVERDHGSPKPEGRGWAGIAYSFLVCPSGRAYEGRGWRREGAHTRGLNDTAYGLCFVQHGGTRTLTRASVEAARELLREGVAGGHLAEPYDIDGHRDHDQTECPGQLIYLRLGELRPPAADEDVDRPRPGDRRYSPYLGEVIVLTRYAGPNDWSYIRESLIQKIGTRGTVPWSHMPPERR